MHAFLICGSTKQKQEEKVKDLLQTFDVAEVDELKTLKKHLIQTVRQINKKLLIPAQDPQKNRAIVIYDAHLLTQDAANAFLKTLEEPPKNTLFILTAPQKESVLATISSRTQVVELEGSLLEMSGEELDKASLIFDQLTKGSFSEKMKVFDSLGKREEGISFCVGQIIVARNLMKDYLKQKRSAKKIAEFIERLETSKQDLEANVNLKIVLFDLFLHYPSF